MSRAFMNCRYQCDGAFNPTQYFGFAISIDGNHAGATVFNTGDPVADYKNAVAYAFEQSEVLSCSSDVDHFVSDVFDFKFVSMDAEGNVVPWKQQTPDTDYYEVLVRCTPEEIEKYRTARVKFDREMAEMDNPTTGIDPPIVL